MAQPFSFALGRVWPMNGLEASLAFWNGSLEIGRAPLDGADHLGGIKNYTLHNPNVHNLDSGFTFSSHSLDCYPVPNPNLRGSLRLSTILPPQHPKALIDKSFVLMICAAPRGSNKPVVVFVCHNFV